MNGTNDTSISFQFNGSATESSIIDLLQGITYDNSNDDNPDSTDRQVLFTFTDVGVLNSGSNSTYIRVTPTNDNPVISAFTNTPTFVEDSTAFEIVDANVSVSDPDAPSDFNGGTLTVSVYKNTPGNFISEDVGHNSAISIGSVTALDQKSR